MISRYILLLIACVSFCGAQAFWNKILNLTLEVYAHVSPLGISKNMAKQAPVVVPSLVKPIREPFLSAVVADLQTLEGGKRAVVGIASLAAFLFVYGKWRRAGIKKQSKEQLPLPLKHSRI